MSEQRKNSRQSIIEQANRLFYTKGYNQTSIADVSEAVGITKGNLNYHFHSKDALLDAVIDKRKEDISRMLSDWEQAFQDPKERLKRFAQVLLNEEQALTRYGCPMGSLNVELGKTQLPLQAKAKEMFELFRQFLNAAFAEIDKKNAQRLCLHLLSMAQGAALMAYIYGDRQILHDEYKEMASWIEAL